MSNEWTERELDELFDLSSGKSITPGAEGQYPAFGSNGLIGGSDKSLFDAGIIIGRVGAYCGSIAISNSPFWASDNTIVALPKEGIDLRFAYFLLHNARLNRHAGGSAQPLLTQATLKPLRFAVPSLHTQRRVASILGAYDDLIEVNRGRIALLEEMAQRLFAEIIIRPIGQFPEAAGTSKKADLPKGWKIEPLANVADIIMGQSPPSAELNTDGKGLVFHQGVSDFGELFPGRRVFCDYVTGKRVAEEGDILFSVRAPVGRINCATEKMILGRGVSAIRHRDGKRAYLLAHLRRTFHTTDLIGNGAIYRAVNRGDVERVSIVLAPPEIVSTLNGQLEDILKLVWALHFSNIALAGSRDLLVPRLISGELSFSSAERELEAVA